MIIRILELIDIWLLCFLFSYHFDDQILSTYVIWCFNNNGLKKKLGEDDVVQHYLSDISSISEVQILSQAILDWRVMTRYRYPVTKVLVQWANLPIEDATQP